MRTARQNALYYADRKSEQNMRAALEACTQDFELCSPPFGRTMRGADENIKGMSGFFAIFPDYKVEPGHILCDETCVLMTGYVCLTPNAKTLGLPAPLKSARLAFSAAFETRNNLLSRETFLVDLVDLCKQSGLPLEVALRLFGHTEEIVA